MRFIAVPVLFNCAIGVSANLKVPSFQVPRGWDSARPGMAVQSLKSFSTRSTSQQGFNPVQHFHRPPVRSDMVFAWASQSSKGAPATVVAKATDAESEAPPAEKPAEKAAPQKALKNLYGEELKECGSSDIMCTYDGDIPNLCVSFRKLQILGLDMPPYNKERNLECKSVLGALFKPMPEGKEAKDLKAGTPVCDATPDFLFTSPKSQDAWDEKVQGTMKWSLDGPETYLWDRNVTTTRTEIGSKKAKGFRRAIDVLCRYCALKAPSDGAKKALDSGCKALGWKEEMTYARPFDIDKKLFSQPSSNDISIFAVAVVGLLVGGGLVFTVRSMKAKKVRQDGAQYESLVG